MESVAASTAAAAAATGGAGDQASDTAVANGGGGGDGDEGKPKESQLAAEAAGGDSSKANATTGWGVSTASTVRRAHHPASNAKHGTAASSDNKILLATAPVAGGGSGGGGIDKDESIEPPISRWLHSWRNNHAGTEHVAISDSRDHESDSHIHHLQTADAVAQVAAAKEDEARQAFSRYDSNQDGVLDPGELAQCLHDYGIFSEEAIAEQFHRAGLDYEPGGECGSESLGIAEGGGGGGGGGSGGDSGAIGDVPGHRLTFAEFVQLHNGLVASDLGHAGLETAGESVVPVEGESSSSGDGVGGGGEGEQSVAYIGTTQTSPLSLLSPSSLGGSPRHRKHGKGGSMRFLLPAQ